MGKSRRHRRKNPFKKLITVLFILVIGYFVFSLYKKYSFSNEKADLYKYLHVKGDEIALYLNDTLQSFDGEKVISKGIKKNDVVYLPLSFVKEYINNRFYYARDINKILYCLYDEIKVVGDSDIHQIGNAPYIIFKEEPYLLLDYVKDYTNIRYDKFLDEENKRVYIYNDWDKEDIAYMKGKEALRLQGGNKSAIITELKKGEEIKILDKMTKWIKVKTANGYIGYIRKTKIYNEDERIPVSSYIERIRVSNRMKEKPCIGFHQLYSNYSSTKLTDLLKNAKEMNVIAPTWFAIKDNEGNIRSIANDVYTQVCHKKKLEVWATLNNFDLADVDEKALFSSTIIRRKMIDKILREVKVNLLDGINLDIEQVPVEAGEDYVEFVRELSIELTKVGCKLSIDTYVPYAYNKHYDLKEFNDFCDYVIIMCYDEHHSGSTEAGSVSSLKFVKDGINLSLYSVDKEKLIAAFPFYSRIWTTNNTTGKVTSVALGSIACENQARTQGLKFIFDDATSQNYGSKFTLDGDLVECWLEDEASLFYKMGEARKSDIGGTAAWKLTQERENFFKIINLNLKP